jgi:hypothetical protein
MYGHVYVAASTTKIICEWVISCMQQQEKWMMMWRKKMQEN